MVKCHIIKQNRYLLNNAGKRKESSKASPELRDLRLGTWKAKINVRS